MPNETVLHGSHILHPGNISSVSTSHISSSGSIGLKMMGEYGTYVNPWTWAGSYLASQLYVGMSIFRATPDIPNSQGK